MQLLQEAHRLFETFKGRIVGLLFSSKDREWSRDLFLTRTPAKAFRLIECELNFMYISIPRWLWFAAYLGTFYALLALL